MRHGTFDSDTAALAERIQSHDKFGSRDLNEWIFSLLDPREGHAILDLGCGTGKQSIPLAHLIGPRGHLVSADISPQAIEALTARAKDEGIADRIEAHQVSLDQIGEAIAGSTFDRIVASYSIYYVDDPDQLFETLSRAINADGILFFCGPSRANNAEIIDFHNVVKGASTGSAGSADVFMEGHGPRLAAKWFDGVRTHSFENALRFDSPEALVAYWSSYNLYDPVIADAFESAARRHFESQAVFQTTKRVIGITAVPR